MIVSAALMLWGLVATVAMASILQISQGLGLSRLRVRTQLSQYATSAAR